jgi:hypothetical protein
MNFASCTVDPIVPLILTRGAVRIQGMGKVKPIPLIPPPLPPPPFRALEETTLNSSIVLGAFPLATLTVQQLRTD